MSRPDDKIEYPAFMMERAERAAEEALCDHPGRSNNAFRKTEALLDLGKYQAALRFFGAKEHMRGYRDVIDFLLCELFPEHKAACEAFYADAGPSLNEALGAEEMARCDRAMVCLLVMASIIREDADYPGQTCPVRWASLVRFAREAISQAPRPSVPMPQ